MDLRIRKLLEAFDVPGREQAMRPDAVGDPADLRPLADELVVRGSNT